MQICSQDGEENINIQTGSKDVAVANLLDWVSNEVETGMVGHGDAAKTDMLEPVQDEGDWCGQ